MAIQESFVEAEKRFIDLLNNPEQFVVQRTLGVVALEKELHSSLKPWANDHKRRYRDKGMGTIPFLPSLFPDQMINIPGRETIMRPVGMSEKRFIKLHRFAYDKAVGSKTVAGEIINAFQETPAFDHDSDEESVSLVDFTVDMLENGGSIAIATGHLDRLTDITDFTDGLNLAVIYRHGLKYADRFKVVVNKLMTRETLYKLPAPNLISLGLAPRWGLPLVGSEKWGVPTAAQDLVNGLLAKTLVAELRERGQVVGIVPAGSAAIVTKNQIGQIEKLAFPHSDATAALFARYDAIIPANRWRNKILIGRAIPASKPRGVSSKEYGHELTDQINYALALQASELTDGLPIEFARLARAGNVSVSASTDLRFIDAPD